MPGEELLEQLDVGDEARRRADRPRSRLPRGTGYRLRNSMTSPRVIGWPLTVARVSLRTSGPGGVARLRGRGRRAGGRRAAAQRRAGRGQGQDGQEAGAEALSHRTLLPDGRMGVNRFRGHAPSAAPAGRAGFDGLYGSRRFPPRQSVQAYSGLASIPLGRAGGSRRAGRQRPARGAVRDARERGPSRLSSPATPPRCRPRPNRPWQGRVEKSDSPSESSGPGRYSCCGQEMRRLAARLRVGDGLPGDPPSQLGRGQLAGHSGIRNSTFVPSGSSGHCWIAW